MSDDDARADAVREAHEVLGAGWPDWAAAHGLSPAPPLRHGPAKVTLVGEDADSSRYVAAVPFTFEHDGQQFRGFARGPLSAPMFLVSRDVEEPAPTGRDRFRLRRGRRRD